MMIFFFCLLIFQQYLQKINITFIFHINQNIRDTFKDQTSTSEDEFVTETRYDFLKFTSGKIIGHHDKRTILA